MSIKFDKDNKAHWFREPGEIGCRIGFNTLSKSLKNEMSLDPQNSVFVFRNNENIDAYEQKKTESGSGFFSWIKKIFASVPQQDDARDLCNLFVIKRGSITFEAPQIDNLTSKDFMDLRCDCTFSAEIVDPETFIINTMDQFSSRGFAGSVASQIQQNHDVAMVAELNENIHELQKQNDKFYSQLSSCGKNQTTTARIGNWLHALIGREVVDEQGQRREIQRMIDNNDAKIRDLRRQIEDINRRGESTYERDNKACQAMSLDYYCYTKDDLYRTFLHDLVRGILQRTVAEYSVDEITKGFDFITLVQDVLENNINIVTRLRNYGLKVRIDDIRFVDESAARIIEDVRKSAESLRKRNWLLTQRVQELSYNREMQQLEVEEHEVALDKLAEGYSFAQSTARSRMEHDMSLKELDAEKSTRLRVIEDLVKRNKLEKDQETELFTLELKRQGMLKQAEFDKFEAELAVAERDRQWAENEQQMRHLSFVKALAQALELDELQAKKRVDDFKRSEALSALQYKYSMEDLAIDHDLDKKKKADAYTDSRWQNSFSQKVQTDDYLRSKKVEDAAADLEIKRNEVNLEQNTADRVQAREQQAADAAFQRNMQYFQAVTNAKRDERADNRAARQDELSAQVEIKRNELAAETARLNSEDYRARMEAEAAAKAQSQAVDMIFSREDERARREQEQTQQKYAHEENMARINSDAHVANAVSREKDNTIAHLDSGNKNAQQNNSMVCDKCNKYYPEGYSLCPMCGEKLRKVQIG